MERGFLSQKWSRVGRGVKEKQVSTGVKSVDRTKMNTDAGTGLFTESDGTLNDANPLKEVVSPSVIDEHVAMEVQSPLVAQTYSVKSHVVKETVTMECPVVNTPDVGPNLPLPTQEANSAGNVPGKPSYATATEMAPDENLLKEDVSTVPVWVKLHSVPITAYSEDGLSAIATKLGAREKTVKKPSQTSRGVPVGPKMGFKPQKEYRLVTKKTNASSSSNKKKGVEPTIEKINKIEGQICEGKLRLLDNDGNPLVPTGIVESDSEVEVVFDETANLRISTSGKDGCDKGYGTNSLLEQWRDSYPDNDDYDPYDDDIYENHDLSEHLQSICDDLDITVRGRKKK
ncbi:ATPase, F1/V1/A1 complex, alpha/beta subunit [Tanacetum coccineum]